MMGILAMSGIRGWSKGRLGLGLSILDLGQSKEASAADAQADHPRPRHIKHRLQGGTYSHFISGSDSVRATAWVSLHKYKIMT